LRQAATADLQRGGADSAVRFLRRALAEPPARETRADLLADLASAEGLVGLPEASAHLEEALALTDDEAVRRSRVGQLARLLLFAGRGEEATALLSREPADVQVGDEAGLELAATLMVVGQYDPAAFHAAVRRVDPLRDRLTGRTPAERLLLAMLSFAELRRGGPCPAAAELASLALRDGALLREQSADSVAFHQAVYVLLCADRAEEAGRVEEEALADAQARGSLYGFAYASGARAVVHHRVGNLVAAEADAATSLEAAAPWANWVVFAAPMTVAVEVLIETGEVTKAAQLLRDHGLFDPASEFVRSRFLLHTRARMRLAQGDAAGALDDFLHIDRRELAAGFSSPFAGAPHLGGAALALWALGDAQGARSYAGRSLAAARVCGVGSVVGVALRVAGLVEESPAVAEGLLAESAVVLGGSPARLELARSLVEWGSLLRRGGRLVRARDPLRRGLELAHRCGATALADRALHELRAAGSRPRRRTLTGVDALTATERRVADMAASGLGNRDIAQALFVTTRTVESHLTRVYQKLGIGSRARLPDALHQPPDPA
jgi:DNA-binding CsgD family transcriptional regulator